ncbi:hypothetical protein YC2023_090152 [Brassica napus]
MVQNTVLTDRSRNHPGVRSLIGIRSMSMTARPRRSQPPLRRNFLSEALLDSLLNYDWLNPLSGYVGNPSPGPAIIIKHLFLIFFESSLDRRVLTRPTSPHLTDESSLDRTSTDESSLDRTSTDESSLDRRVLTRPKSRRLHPVQAQHEDFS